MAFDRDDTWQESTLDIFRRWGMTLLIVSVLLLVSTFPFTLAGLGEIRPSFLLIAVYYWAVVRPATLPPYGVFFVGLAFDLIADYPFGLTALTLVVAQWLTKSQRKFLLGQSFIVMWMGFTLVAGGAALLQWGVFSLFDWRLLAIEPCLVSALLTTVFFPLAVPVLSGFGTHLNGREKNPRD
jgi:rod shape-determining protein MreD